MVQGDLPRAEKLLAVAVRTMKGLNDRSKLCEAQRSLAEVYVQLGRLTWLAVAVGSYRLFWWSRRAVRG